MTMIIRFGVNDIPYGDAYKAARKRRPGPQPAPGTAAEAAQSRVSTGDVAEYLERRYHVMQFFAEHWSDRIGDVILQALEDRLEAVSMGRPVPEGPLLSTTDLAPIAEEFRAALDERAFNGHIEGVPTKAALRGVSHRFKHPYARRPSRPSFIDTGLYSSNMRVWMD